MKAIILSVGDELLRGDTADTNASFLARLLGERGVEVVEIATVGDSRIVLADRLREFLGRVGLVCVSGGLGPTRDDITRWAVADVVGRPLRLDESSLGRIRERFRRVRKPMGEGNEKQALLPEGAEIVENPRGTAPGFLCNWKGSRVLVLPGVPFEMEGMAEKALERALGARVGGGGRAFRKLSVIGLPESEVDARLGPLMDRGGNPLLGLSVGEGEIALHITAWPGGGESAESLLEDVEKKVRLALGDAVHEPGGVGGLLGLLRERGWRIAAAESCTGGLVADRLTDVPGASELVVGGVVAYTRRVKMDLLDVGEETLDGEGEVSEAVARQMAQGVCARTGADVGIATTGIAGPGGGTEEMPVGRVCIGICHPGGLWAGTWHFRGDRRRVKEGAASTALRALADLLGGPGGGR